MNQAHFSSAARFNDYLGLAALYLFAFSAFNNVAHANFTFALLFLATLPKLPAHWRSLMDDRLLRVALVFIVYVSLRAILALWQSPVPAAATFGGWEYWLRRAALPALVVAYWLNVDARRIYLCLLLLFAGFVTRILTHLDWQLMAAFVSGRHRASFANAPVNFGLWNAVMLLAALMLVRPFLESTRSRPMFWLKLMLWAGGTVIAINGLIFSQSRGAWLAALVILPASLLWLARQRQGRSRMLRWCAVGLLTVAAFGALNYRTISHRLSQEHKTFADIFSGDFSAVPPTSVGLRIDMYRAAWGYWRRKPMLGWGPGSSPYLLSHTREVVAQYHFPHFHDGYIDTLVQLGVVGFLLFSCLLVIILKTLLQAMKTGALPLQLAVFILGAFMLVAVVALIDKPLGSRFGDYFLALFGGFAYTAHLHRLLNAGPRRGTGKAPAEGTGTSTSNRR